MQARRDSLTPVFCHTCIRKRTCHLHQDTVGTSISMRRRLSGCKWTPSTCITIVRVPCQSVLLLDTSTPCQRPPPGLSTLRITKGLPCPAWVICGACSCSPSPSYTAHTLVGRPRHSSHLPRAATSRGCRSWRRRPRRDSRFGASSNQWHPPQRGGLVLYYYPAR
jgi:hypothetical protein